MLGVDGPAIMATTTTLGTVALWDLDNQRLVAVSSVPCRDSPALQSSCCPHPLSLPLQTMSDCHDGSLSGLRYLPSRALLLTAGHDNKLKVRNSFQGAPALSAIVALFFTPTVASLTVTLLIPAVCL